MVGWQAIGAAQISIDKANPLSQALPKVLKVEIPAGATGEVGFLNEGFWGIDVKQQPYKASFYVKGGAGFPGKLTGLTVSLRSKITSQVWTQQSITFEGKNLSSTGYTQINTVLTPDAKAPNSNNTFAITFRAEEAAGQTLYFNLISLFPPTYKNRPNGLRLDLAETLADLKPKFLRFPGGNHLQGYSIETRWQWKKNIGPLIDRPGRPGTWGYHTTDGLGYLDYLYWCEDMDIEPLLVVYAGYSLGTNNQVGPTVPADQLDFYINEAIEQIEYAIGDPNTTTWGKLRAQHGHPEPFKLKHIGIGNEDWFSDSYYWRFPRFLAALKKAYPDMIYIASQATENSPANRNVSIPQGNMWDMHHYQTPQFFKNDFGFFDNWQQRAGYPNVSIFVGEYSVLSVDTPSGSVDWVNGVGRLRYPGMLSAIGEAIYGIAMERNPSVVTLSSYAPLLQNLNDYQWLPNMIAFTADSSQTIKSTSYWKHWMFARSKGAETVQTINESGDFNPVWWHASAEPAVGGGEKLFVKLVNAASKPAPVTLVFEGVAALKMINVTSLSHPEDELAFNFLGNSTINPKFSAIADLQSRTSMRNGSVVLKYDIPGIAVEVLEIVY
jgi:alpha-N-arabinofuranosidase